MQTKKRVKALTPASAEGASGTGGGSLLYVYNLICECIVLYTNSILASTSVLAYILCII